MKKIISAVLLTALIAISVPFSAMAQTRYCNTRSPRYSRSYFNERTNYNRRNYIASNRQGFYGRHRNIVNIGLASGGGAIVGGIIGGRRGILTGALLGGGAGALYTYVLRKHRY